MTTKKIEPRDPDKYEEFICSTDQDLFDLVCHIVDPCENSGTYESVDDIVDEAAYSSLGCDCFQPGHHVYKITIEHLGVLRAGKITFEKD